MQPVSYKKSFLLALLTLAGRPLLAAGLTGDWKVDGDVVGNPVALVCSLKQEDAKLSGKCVSTAGNIDSPVTGKVDGKNVAFQFDFNYNGMAMTMAFSGASDTDASMKGNIEVMGVGGPFTAVKTVTTP
jgi:hypothetical protein